MAGMRGCRSTVGDVNVNSDESPSNCRGSSQLSNWAVIVLGRCSRTYSRP